MYAYMHAHSCIFLPAGGSNSCGVREFTNPKVMTEVQKIRTQKKSSHIIIYRFEVFEQHKLMMIGIQRESQLRNRTMTNQEQNVTTHRHNTIKS
jgi:hypothetical protein